MATSANKSTNHSDLDMHPKITVAWEKSKDEAWAQMSERMKTPQPQKQLRILSRSFSYAAAAVIVLLLSVSAVMQFYTKTITAGAGEHFSAVLPDGSEIELNAASELAYKPLLWSFNRKVKLTGEAFFKVEKGQKFTVVSKMGSTQVLGTSFNIFARDKAYEVTCLTGKVKVTSAKSKSAVLLTKNQKAELLDNGNLQVETDEKAAEQKAWIDYSFIYTAVPLSDLLSEVERQYGVKISKDDNIKISYTGNFKKIKSVEDVLNLICIPLNLTFEKKSDTHYHVKQNEP